MDRSWFDSIFTSIAGQWRNIESMWEAENLDNTKMGSEPKKRKNKYMQADRVLETTSD